ncbi:hypothetical protein AB1K70_14050 [Bremerella sp. JC770]|uniref:hypothetical protein n=1 Tax=Bremerella sp. JC770 TaxID=3232137 RepID=UPI003458F3D6
MILTPLRAKVFVSLLLTILLAGCSGQDGFDRVIVHGTVQYDGQPVPKGAVWFVPDVSAGREAPTGFALIRDGHYETERAKSPVSGKYTVKVTGFDTIPPTPAEQAEWGDREFPGHPLFPEHRLSQEISQDDMTLDIEVPKAKGRTRR